MARYSRNKNTAKWVVTLIAILMLAVAVTAAITQGFKDWNPWGWLDDKEQVCEHVDKDNDSICDKCDEEFCLHVDEDEDSICDKCDEELEKSDS